MHIKRKHNPNCFARIFIILLLVSLSGCAYFSKTLPKAIYRGYTGPEIPDDKLATLEISHRDINWIRIDDNILVESAKYSAIRLQPGLHQVEINATFYGSIMVIAGGSITLTSPFLRVPFEAGQTYKCKTDRSRFGSHSGFHFWIEDSKSGIKIVHTRYPFQYYY